MRTDRLTHFTTHGTGPLPRRIHLADRTTITIHAGYGAYCRPRPHPMPGLSDVPADYTGPYTHLEVYLHAPLTGPAGWEQHHGDAPADADGQNFAFVPAALVQALVVEHGGEHMEQDLADDISAAMAEGFLPELAEGVISRLPQT